MCSALLSLVLAIVSPLSVTSRTRCSGAAATRASRSSSQSVYDREWVEADPAARAPANGRGDGEPGVLGLAARRRGAGLSQRALRVPASFALGPLLGPPARLGGSLLGPDELLGSLQLLDDRWPSEVAAEGGVRDAVITRELAQRRSGRPAAQQLGVGFQSAQSAVARHPVDCTVA